jgi:hypothetical protein
VTCPGNRHVLETSVGQDWASRALCRRDCLAELCRPVKRRTCSVVRRRRSRPLSHTASTLSSSGPRTERSGSMATKRETTYALDHAGVGFGGTFLLLQRHRVATERESGAWPGRVCPRPIRVRYTKTRLVPIHVRVHHLVHHSSVDQPLHERSPSAELTQVSFRTARGCRDAAAKPTRAPPARRARRLGMCAAIIAASDPGHTRDQIFEIVRRPLGVDPGEGGFVPGGQRAALAGDARVGAVQAKGRASDVAPRPRKQLCVPRFRL